MNILGLSAFYHESSCCLLRHGELIAAASEERFTRVKHDRRLPVEAFRFCLEAGGLRITDLDAVAYYELPQRKLSRQLWSGRRHGPADDGGWLDPRRPERAIRERLGFEGRILSFPHHLSHAASAYYFSGFPEAAVLTVDGVGEWATMTYGAGRGSTLEPFETVDFPHSLGLLYSTLTAYLGFRVNDGEYKVMGLAPYGEPRYLDQIFQLVAVGEGGQIRLNLKHFDFIDGESMFTPSLCDLFGQAPRRAGAPITRFHQDVARSLQLALEEILLEKVTYLHSETGLRDLCMAGGVALNCVANGRIRREGPFERLFVQPAAGDAGGCLGAAALAHCELSGTRPAMETQRHTAFGPRASADGIAGLLDATGLAAEDFRQRRRDLLTATAQRLASGDIVGWFQGAMEHGPRALGNRSILADPRQPDARDRLNRAIKKREDFRPFAPSVLAARAAEHFDLDRASPFMLETCQVTSPLDLPAITHVDGSARPQTVDPATHPRYAALLEAFDQLTGCPVLLNTSFNLAGEPIVCTPIDALFTATLAGLDALVLEDFLIDASALPACWGKLFPSWDRAADDPFQPGRATLSDTLYTFV
ncbi:MAG: carbamoyltransferase N-terminal domain-containing protein [Acidobacteriota bacterium]